MTNTTSRPADDLTRQLTDWLTGQAIPFTLTADPWETDDFVVKVHGHIVTFSNGSNGWLVWYVDQSTDKPDLVGADWSTLTAWLTDLQSRYVAFTADPDNQ